jgi:ATP citrate (pro-S)-lyase
MKTINDLRESKHKILIIGAHRQIIQSMLDFDFLTGQSSPRVIGILSYGKNYERFYFGKNEILIPTYESYEDLPIQKREEVTAILNVRSARRILDSTSSAIDIFPNLILAVIFAEDVPEKHALSLAKIAHEKEVLLLGPASTGLLLPGFLKLGAVGGTDGRQLVGGNLLTVGSIAVICASGGMSNELARIVTGTKHALSFVLHLGGDRFPIVSAAEAFLLAESDPQTKQIIYYGELGGTDEYEIGELIKSGKITKPIIAYIAGMISDLFETPPQFGHAKAMAKTSDESASSKRNVLTGVGVRVPETFADFVKAIAELPVSDKIDQEYTKQMEEFSNRKKALITSSISEDRDGDVYVLGQPLVELAKNKSFAAIVGSLFLGKTVKSEETEKVIDFILKLLVDHGPHVSGAMNTIVSSRAGKDLVSSLSAGLLTIGPRFGGAVNVAAGNWLLGVKSGETPDVFVESFVQKGEYILGIGHKKYRVDLPDPRVKELLTFIASLEKKTYTAFALSVEKVTSSKKGNLILNIDGAIAAVLLDVLLEKEGYSERELEKLVDAEFFNALFVLSRSVGFIGHFLDQKRLDEGLLRLPDELVSSVELE